MPAIFVVDGEEKTLEMRDDSGVDWSGDFIGNTAHGMKQDDEGRYVVNQETYEWWVDMIANWQNMELVIADYKARFGVDEVDRVINDTIGGYDLEDQPARVIEALENAFGLLQNDRPKLTVLLSRQDLAEYLDNNQSYMERYRSMLMRRLAESLTGYGIAVEISRDALSDQIITSGNETEVRDVVDAVMGQMGNDLDWLE